MPSELRNEPWLNPFLRDVRGTVFFDVGANTGEFTEWASSRFDHVKSFEPDPRAYEVLLSRARCNVDPVEVAVGSHSHTGYLGVNTSSLQSMLVTEDRQGHPFGHGEFAHEIEVEVVALRDTPLVADWIKIDTEGGEPDVIRGMAGPAANLIVECHGNLEKVLAEVREKGYLGGRPGIVVEHPLGLPGHEWLIVEGDYGFPPNLRGACNVAD
jgi:FkbM family methyltransferase